MDDSDATRWRQAVDVELSKLRLLDLGYPLDENRIRTPVPHGVAPPQGLAQLYRVVDELFWPDVYVGYFVDPVVRAVKARGHGEPMFVHGKEHFDIAVFGSDGGGGRFALRCDDGSVFYLPSGGAVESGVYLEEPLVASRRVASSTDEFLERLLQDLIAFVHGTEPYRYIMDL